MNDGISEQEAYFASTRGTRTTPVPRYANESPEQKYMRQTRNAVVFIAVIIGLFTTIIVLGLILR
jgi:hypothetical protein